MILKESIELTADSGRSSGMAAIHTRREHKTGRLLGDGSIQMMIPMHMIQNFFVSIQMLIFQ
jgi:hypothetical protein